MRHDIHPVYGPIVVRDNSCGRMFLTRSTLAGNAQTLPTIEWDDGNTYPLVVTEITSYSHPFYTGKNVVLDTAGQVQKFNARYGRRTGKEQA
ncbi:50S ribosomal protein L31 [Bifidobacterium tissieri]|uniref:50S ribosomal protein L31 n=1 Tax=Bifidobacterium tissieri TaxID=1630162 RepID=A0A261FIY1_9BIFI|nr:MULTISPECIES: type B 50S ribosomal protein L31 [Bifidobacterium]OZG59117.1 50S ribosomal protein L31 [Bifidobacterium tissieri]TPF96011.1 50S ribosomal protein L31 [Bifidobacterium sp. UTCIF-39]